MEFRRRKLVLALSLVGVFAAGAVTGAVATVGLVHSKLRALHSADSHAAQKLGVEFLDWRLDLSAEQEVAVEAILGDANRELLQFKTRHVDELRAILTPSLERIDAQLTPRQLERWAPLRKQFVEHVERTAAAEH